MTPNSNAIPFAESENIVTHKITHIRNCDFQNLNKRFKGTDFEYLEI